MSIWGKKPIKNGNRPNEKNVNKNTSDYVVSVSPNQYVVDGFPLELRIDLVRGSDAKLRIDEPVVEEVCKQAQWNQRRYDIRFLQLQRKREKKYRGEDAKDRA